MAITVFNADDHPILKKGITDLIDESEGFESMGNADNGATALKLIRTLKPNVAVLDIEMPEMTGMDVAKTLIEEGTDTAFVLLTLYKDESFLTNSLKMGVKGYLLKESSEREILDCIRSVHEGNEYVSSSLTKFLINNKKVVDNVLSSLSSHEINILKLISRQKTSAEIADMLFISPKTVSNHRTNISKKLNLEGEQNGLLKWAMENKNILDH